MSAMELKTTRWEVIRGVAILTLSRPHRHNAWTGRMHTELRHLIQQAEDDESVRVLVITGDPEGEAFCPGADTEALRGHAEQRSYDAGTPFDIATPGYGIRPEFDADFAFFAGLETVTIAAVNGAAAGVGFALACWCDLRFVAEDAKLTAAHGRLHLPAEYGLSWLLPRLVGQSRAADLLLSGRVLSGREAESMGLAVAAVPTAAVLDRAVRYAEALVVETSPGSLRATKRQLWSDSVRSDPAASVHDAQTRLEQMVTEPDFAEAVAALSERRPPRWSSPTR